MTRAEAGGTAKVKMGDKMDEEAIQRTLRRGLFVLLHVPVRWATCMRLSRPPIDRAG